MVKFVSRTVLSTIVLVMVSIPSVATPEFRGIWVDAFHPGFKTHDEVTQMVNWAEDCHFNALIVQVRKRGDAYYNSNIEPKAADIAADYDPLADVIQQAHAAGLEVHAWVSVYDIMHDSKWYKPGPTHIYNAHPDWLMTNRDGIKVFDKGKIYVDPGVPAVQDHIVSIVLDIVKNYHADGINLDNIRYPGKHGGYNPITVSLFNQQFRRSRLPDDDDPAWCQWRRDQVTNLVRKIQSALNQVAPSVKLSASVVLSEPTTAATMFLEEWDVWTRNELVDSLVPMVYLLRDTMSSEAPKALNSRYDCHVYIGIAGWRLSPQLAAKQIADARQAGADGIAVFSYHYLGPNSTGANCVKGEDLVSSVFPKPADVPSMPWKQ